jgi:nucleotide-binding universal stress UspA family protein
MQILAATDFSTRSNRALRQAGFLSQSSSAHLDVVHVVDDDQPEELVRMEKREAERLLVEQIGSMPELQGIQARPVVVTGDPFNGILEAAAEIKPDLIVMGSHRKQFLLDIFVGTTIERVIRKGSFPVLMVNHEAQRRYQNVIVPTDMSNASAHSIRIALSTGLISDCRLTLLHAFVAVGKGKMFVAGIDQSSIDDYVVNERQNATDELVRFLVANDLGRERWSFWVEEGGPMEVVSKVVEQSRPDLLIMGTHGRSGLAKALIGSVTEEALRSLNVDILAVPPVRQ